MVVAPIWETFIFQLLPILVVDKMIESRTEEEKIRGTSIIVSAFLFGMAYYLTHYLDLIKFMSTFFAGIVLAYSYALYKYKEKNPYQITVIIHGLSNLVFYIPALIIQMTTK